MNESQVERATELWLAHNPWLRKAFRRSAPASEAAPAETHLIRNGGNAADPATAPHSLDMVTVLHRLRELDERQVACVCATVERHLGRDSSTDPAEATRRAVAVGLAIGFSLGSR